MSGGDIDTRSDIYSLGVLPYELLTGAPPFDAGELIRSGFDGIRKTLREQEPVMPSTRVAQELVAADVRRLKNSPETNAPEDSGASSRRLLPTQEILRELRGDLDWVVMKCLEKDRARRYETANGLALDLQRHLGNEPVAARPPSKRWRLSANANRPIPPSWKWPCINSPPSCASRKSLIKPNHWRWKPPNCCGGIPESNPRLTEGARTQRTSMNLRSIRLRRCA